MRPIDADAYIDEQSEGTFLPDITIERFNAITPTLDVKPVVHAEWTDDKCSVCGKGIEDLISSNEWYRNEEPNFCPWCGADMRKGQNNE